MADNAYPVATDQKHTRGDSTPANDDAWPPDEQSTDPVVQAQLDTLEALVRSPVSDREAAFLAESGCQRVVELIAAIGRDPTGAHRGERTDSATRPTAEALGDEPEEPREIGHYRLQGRLGAGGMGTVYKALHKKLEKFVALKVLPEEKMQDAAAVARFEREMKAVGQLDHPHIVRAFDAGEEDGTHFLVMELVEGLDLSTLVQQSGPLRVADACELIRQAAIGLQHVHAHGLIHRDIKPSNLMLTRNESSMALQSRATPAVTPETPRNPHGSGEPCYVGLVKILDLGLALLDPQRLPETSELTSAGQMMGTLDYMAPEQGSDSHQVDIRADIYSLGATLYKLLCGEAPFAGKRYDTPIKKMMALAVDQPMPIAERCPQIPAELAALVDRMLAKQPGDRFAEPREIADALAPFCQGADLLSLLAAAVEARGPGGTERRSVTTDPYLTSASHDTGSKAVPLSSPCPSAGSAVKTQPWSQQPEPAARRRRPWRRVLALALVPLALLLGVIIWINRMRIEVPDGSTVTVRPDGGVEVTLPEQTQAKSDRVRPGNGASAAASVAAQPAEATQWIDLLPLVDLKRDVYSGGWNSESGWLGSDRGELRLPVRVDGDFELEVMFRREQDEQVAILFPVAADRAAALVLCRGDQAGLESFDNKPLHENQAPLRVPSPIPSDGNLATANLAVRYEPGRVTIEVKVDGQSLTSWQGNPNRFSLPRESWWTTFAKPVLGLEVASGKSRPKPIWFTSARLRMLSGKAEPGFRAEVTVGEPIRVERKAIEILPESVEILPGQPISGIALVSRPAKLAGVQSWTVDTRGHRGAILDVEYSPDGKWLASTGRDGTIRVLDAKTECFARLLLGHVGPVTCLTWSPEGKYLASAGNDGTLRFWDVAAGRMLRVISPGGQAVGAVAWSPDGTTLACSHLPGQITLLDPRSGQPTKTFDVSGDKLVRFLEWSPDGHQLATSSAIDHVPSPVHVWDVPDGKLRLTIKTGWNLSGPAWSPDGRILAICDHRTLALYDACSGDRLWFNPSPSGHQTDDPRFSPDGRSVACTTRKGASHIEYWDVATGRFMRTIWGQATIYMTQNAVGWSADGRRIAAGGFNGCVATAALSDAGQRVALAGFMGLGDTWRYGIPAWSPDGAEIALRLDGIDRLRILNLVDASRRSVFAADYAPVVTWSPDGARLAVLDEPTTIWSRDLTTKLAEANLSNKASRYAQWSPSGRLIAASGGGETGLLDPNTMEFTRLWQGWETGHGVFNFAWSADERLLVISREKQILFYDVAARKPIETVNAHESFIQWLALSPDERLIASAAKDGTVRVFEVASRQRLASRTFESPATTLAFSPDGSLLACGGQQACWLLDAKLGQIVHELEGRADALAFSADGKQLLGIAVDGGRRRWDVASGKRLAEDVAHPTLCSPQKLKWSPDRRYVAAWVEGLALHVWRTADAQPMGAIGVLNDDVLYVSREGHYRTTLEAQKDLVYVALTEAGEQQLHTPEGFEKQYGWKNDPAKVRPLADPAAEPGRHDATPQSPVSGGNRSESGGSEDSRD